MKNDIKVFSLVHAPKHIKVHRFYVLNSA